MHQTWGKLLFMHWRIDAKQLRSLVPGPLEIDTFDGSAWIGIIPFTMWDIRGLPPFLPAVPGLSSLHELNVRTYVHCEGVPGVWFFSLDANSAAAVMAARAFYHLPYFNAEIDLENEDGKVDYSLVRTDDPPASFQASWKIGQPLPLSNPDSLEFFLTERYCLYHLDAFGRPARLEIHHAAWRLQPVQAEIETNTMADGLGISLAGAPLLHFAKRQDVVAWWTRALRV